MNNKKTEQENFEIIIKPNDPESIDCIFVNGKKLLSTNGQKLNNKVLFLFTFAF